MKRKVKDILAEYESTGGMMSYSDFKVCLDAIYYHIREAALHKDGTYQARKHLKTADRICDFVADMFCDQHNNLVSWLKGEPCTFYHPTTRTMVRIHVRDDYEVIYNFLKYCMLLEQHKPVEEDFFYYLAYILCEPVQESERGWAD